MPPGCIVLDVRLPGTSGLEFQKVLIEADIHLPAIFITERSAPLPSTLDWRHKCLVL